MFLFCKQLYLLQSILCFDREKPKNKTLRTLINADGRVLNINEPKYTHKNTHTHTTPVKPYSMSVQSTLQIILAKDLHFRKK